MHANCPCGKNRIRLRGFLRPQSISAETDGSETHTVQEMPSHTNPVTMLQCVAYELKVKWLAKSGEWRLHGATVQAKAATAA
jgi:hypothetical protein